MARTESRFHPNIRDPPTGDAHAHTPKRIERGAKNLNFLISYTNERDRTRGWSFWAERKRARWRILFRFAPRDQCCVSGSRRRPNSYRTRYGRPCDPAARTARRSVGRGRLNDGGRCSAHRTTARGPAGAEYAAVISSGGVNAQGASRESGTRQGLERRG